MARGAKKKQTPYDLSRWTEAGPSRPQVTRERVVLQALELLDEEGFDGLTMRRLAEHLGIKAASLYNHVRDKDELLTLMSDAICADIADLDGSRPWREQAKTVAMELRRVLTGRRDAARVLAATAPITPHRLRLIEQSLRMLEAAGFTPAMSADVASVMNSYVVGLVLDETAGLPADTASARRMREEARRWFKSLPRAQFPTLIALADELIDSPALRRFEVGLNALLDGFELRLDDGDKSRRRR